MRCLCLEVMRGYEVRVLRDNICMLASQAIHSVGGGERWQWVIAIRLRAPTQSSEVRQVDERSMRS